MYCHYHHYKKGTLLQQLRANLTESTSTACIVSGYAHNRRRRNARRKDAVDKLVEAARHDQSLTEAAALWVEARNSIRLRGLDHHTIYIEALNKLGSRTNLTEAVSLKIHESLEPLLEKADSTPMMSEEFIKTHEAFEKAFAKKFDVTVTRIEPVAEGLYLYTNTEDTAKLSHHLEDIRHFAQSKDYLVLKKGTTDETSVQRDARWTFIYDQHLDYKSREKDGNKE